MNATVKRILKKVIPESLIIRPGDIKTKAKIKKARQALESASNANEWLDIKELERLQNLFPLRTAYKYDADTLVKRGTERRDLLLNMVDSNALKDFLELGCYDGMVSWALSKSGKHATAIDFRDEGFDKRAIEQGVIMKQMDAANMNFADSSFDFVFSYDAFEHFGNPESVLKESIRVVRKGGYIYLEFGPLFQSVWGLHAYRQITVPYCQFLFTRETMDTFCNQKGITPIDFNHCNGWTLVQFRAMFEKYKKDYEIINYKEFANNEHLDYIINYPQCFKGKTDLFENLTVASIQVLLKKK
jgi:ubiquinone/menaquinone biosynthesis C-methylase UbiE